MVRLIRDTLPILPRSHDAKGNTVDVVWSTGAAVRRDNGQGGFIKLLINGLHCPPHPSVHRALRELHITDEN